MLPKSSSQKTLRDVLQEERTTTTKASRLLCPDASSLSNPSFRNYYGVASAGSVPFLWESAPGTPKNAISATALPPLTPPPSYYSKAVKSKTSKKLLSSSSKPASFVHSMFRRSHTTPFPSASNDKESVHCGRRKRLLASPRSSFSLTSRGEDEDGEGAQGGGGAVSPTSTLCFRARHSGQSGGGAGRLLGLLSSVDGGQGTAAS